MLIIPLIFLHRKEQQITDNNCVIIIHAQITLFLLRGISESLCDRKFNVTRREEQNLIVCNGKSEVEMEVRLRYSGQPPTVLIFIPLYAAP